MKSDHKTRGIFSPSYNELSLFLIGITILVLLIIDGQMRREVGFVTDGRNLPTLIPFCLLLFGQGLVFSFVHLFTDGRKNSYEKFCMLFFAIFANASSGFAAFVHVIRVDGMSPLIIFPTWNLLNGLILMGIGFMALMSGGDVEHLGATIEEDDATLPQALLGLLILGGGIALGHSILELHWSMTFSLCVTYISNFDRLIQGLSNQNQGH